jgi:Rps23 Pro-64 3,4-dihydroxylase Tpa1-like proline 4-hydroxylase
MNRNEYAKIIAQKLKTEIARLRDEFHQHTVQSCVIDNLLPEAEVQKIFEAFPDKNMMMLKKSLRENKYVAAQMDKYTPILEEIIYAFQDPRVLKLVEEITGIQEMVPDEHLYAGGISLMAKDNFLNPIWITPTIKIDRCIACSIFFTT